MAAATPCILVSDTSVSTALNREIVGRAGGTLEKAELVRERSGTELETPAPLHTSCVISDKSLYPSALALFRLKTGDLNVCFITEVW